MGLQQLLAACTLLFLCKADQNLRTVNSMLDPNRLTWWRTKWAPSPIQLSSNNANQNGLTATFYICPSTSIANGVLEITFPSSSFTISADAANKQTVNGQVVSVSGLTLVSGVDMPVVVTSVKNPTQEGAYGPFALRTRTSLLSQQMDVNLSFGTIYIRAQVGTITSATASIVDAPATGTVINRSSNTLSFRFKIAVSLWRFDMFVITIDSKWTINSGATCSSSDYTGRWNNFNGTTSTTATNPHALACYIVPKATTSTPQIAYIYGLAVDGIDTYVDDNKYVDLRITSVVSPNAQYPSHAYSWTITTYRFGTFTMLEQATITTGPTVATDVPGAVTWGLTWGSVVGEIQTGLSYFMDMSITLTNPIPQDANNWVEIEVSETIAATVSAGGTDNWFAGSNCYVISYLGNRSVTCTVSSNTIKLTPLPALPASTTIKIRNLVTIAATSTSPGRIKNIRSYLTTSTPIDVSTSTSMGTFTVAASGVAVADFKMDTVVANSVTQSTRTGGNGLNTQSLQFYIKADAATTTSTTDTTFTIGCAFASALDDFSFGIPTSTTDFNVLTTSTGITSVGLTALTTNKPSFSLGSSGTHGTLTFTGAINSSLPASPNGYALSVYQAGSVSTPPYITLPRVASNIATAYECRLKITVTNGTTQRGVVRFLITPQNFDNTANVLFNVPCTAAVPGMPVIFQLKPLVHKITASSADTIYYLEFEFALGDMGTGLTGISTISTTNGRGSDNALDTKVSYPIDRTGLSGTQSGKLFVDGSGTINSFIAVTGVGEIATTVTTAPLVIFPIGGVTAAAIQPTVRSYYVYSETKDPRFKYITHQTQATAITLVTSAGITLDTKNAISGSSTINWETNSSGVVLNVSDAGHPALASEASTTNAYYYVVLPTGYMWPSGRTIRRITTTTSTTFTNVWTFSSPEWTFAYPGVLVNSGTSGTTLNLPQAADGTYGTLGIAGFQLPPGAVASSNIKIVTGATGASPACSGVSLTDTQLVSTTGAVFAMSVSNLAIKMKGPDGINVGHTVSFTLTHGIPTGGKIVMAYNVAWTSTTCTACSVTGLTPDTGKSAVTCDASTANSITVKDFAAFTTANSVLTIAVTGLLAPLNTGNTAFVTSLTSQTSGLLIIDQAEAAQLANTPVVVSTGTDTGKTTWSTTKKLIPSTVSTTADLYLKFSLTHSLYKTCGTITITSPISFNTGLGDCKNLIFFTLQHVGCTISGSSIEITLGQDYAQGTALEIYADSVLNNPTTTAALTGGFSITTKWASTTVDSDTTSTVLAYTATAALPTTSTITGTTTNSLVFIPRTAGEFAAYTFNFRDTVAFATTDQYWIVFPPQFDYFLGDTWVWFSKEPNTYYIDCASAQLGTVYCTVDHNIVVVTGNTNTSGSTDTSITISGIINPPAALTDNFQIYHMDSTGEVKSITQSYGKITPTAFAADLNVRSLDQTDRRLFKPSDYKWRLYIVDGFLTESQLQVQFPKEFDLNKFDKKDSYSCFTTYQDQTSTSTDRVSARTWNSASSCTVSGNFVTLPAPSTQFTFKADYVTTWTLQSVANPQWGVPRAAQLGVNRDYDIVDSTLWPLDKTWGSQFNFFVYQSGPTNYKYSSRSYPNTNAMYAGFVTGYRQILVNNYLPITKSNRIIVYAGTQTADLKISTVETDGPMAAKQIIFTPSANTRTPDGGKLKFTSVIDNWTLFQSFYSMRFRVAAAYDTAKGLYYIDWSNNETKQTGVSDVQYDTPVSTLVEVVALVPGYSSITIAPIPNLAVGSTSIPIRLSVNFSPHSDVTVGIAVSGTITGISVNPTSLSFAPDVSEKYFEIQIDSAFDIATYGATQTLAFTLTGTDKDAFLIPGTLSFMVIQPLTTPSAGSVTSFGLTPATRTTVSFSPSVDQYGVVYYQLSARGTTVPSFSELKAAITTLVGQNATNSSPGVSEGAIQQSDPEADETWIAFQKRLFKAHLATKWVGAISMNALTGVQTVPITWLYAGTDYQLIGYLDNLITNSVGEPAVRTEYFTTSAIPAYQPVVFKYEGAVLVSFMEKVADTYADIIGVNPKRLDSGTFTATTSRLLQSTTSTTTTTVFSSFSYNLLPNRFSELPTPADQAQMDSLETERLKTTLKSAGISNTWSGFSRPTPQTPVIPTWISSPEATDSRTDSVSVSLRASVSGQTCCVALTETSIAPLPEQVMLGLDAHNADASHTCIDTDTTLSLNSIQITGLEYSTTYYVYCSATDTYPLWPTQMAYSAASPIQPLAITTLTPEVTTSNASYFAALFLLFLH